MIDAVDIKVLRVRLDVPEKSVIASAADIILKGGVIVYPTETLYGIGADARNSAAVRKVIAAKRRQDARPILVLADSIEMVQMLTAEIPQAAFALMKRFWPGPLTIVFKAAAGIPEEIAQGSGTIGIRIPDNTFCIELLKMCACPITSTSANVSGEPAPRTVADIRRALGEGIDLYIDAGMLPESKPSTVISIVEDPPKLIREGVISFEDVQTVLPRITR